MESNLSDLLLKYCCYLENRSSRGQGRNKEGSQSGTHESPAELVTKEEGGAMDMDVLQRLATFRRGAGAGTFGGEEVWPTLLERRVLA